MDNRIEFQLADATNQTQRKGYLDIYKHGIDIHIDGYGECDAADGIGTPIYIEMYSGKLKVHLWNDINSEEPKTIDMEGACEDRREI